MLWTKADTVPGTYRKVVASRAPRKVLGSSTSAINSTTLSLTKAENKYAGGNPVCVRPTPKRQKGTSKFFRSSPKDSEKENQIPEEVRSSGLGKAKRKACPLQPDPTDDEKE
ncbi:PREDICTED: PCNA-associated factor-like isoform X1 [Galeopterus variegatus]|uniref:PCNA-associated factor n=1 Tax=Galeopterus variegatus TaxID=482537 RepID=A0ABM0QPP6_GALVR|nr:PREDICTED: PCNA-associated factor-like isoform X1 [Galeopterus variegatus]